MMSIYKRIYFVWLIIILMQKLQKMKYSLIDLNKLVPS